MIEPPAVVTADDWTRCAPWIDAALVYARGTHNLADVLAEIEANRATFWPFPKSVAVTQIITWPRLTQLHYWVVGGDLRELLANEPAVTQWGAAHGCTRFTTAGRPGWKRAMAPLGYELILETCAKDIPLSLN